jgi:hypothetical protein
LSFSFAQNQNIQNFDLGEYYMVYYKDMIEKNNVRSFKISYCDNNDDSYKKKDTILNSEHFFNNNSDVYKVINYKKNGKIYSVDSNVYNNENNFELIYKSKNGKSFRPVIKCFRMDEKESILNNKEKQKILIKDKFEKLLFCSENKRDIDEYSISKNKIQFSKSINYDINYFYQKIIVYNPEFKNTDTINYKLDYENLNGKSIHIRDKMSYLYSIMLFNSSKKIIKENFFDIPYNLISVKNVKDIKPNCTINYHYLDNGLFDYIEFLYFTGGKEIFSFQYKYYDR